MSESVNVSFVGDIYLGEQPYLSLNPEIRQILKSADLVIANQEGPITDCDKAIGGKCCLKSDVKSAEILKDWGIDIVSLANNHMFDYGWEGFKQTRQQLDKVGIRYLGAGENLEQASRPLIVEVKGTRIGLLAYSWEFVQTKCATDNAFGCAPLDLNLMISQIRELSRQADIVIAMLHWGYCEYPIPTPEQVSMAKSLFNAGAIAIVGHHSHVVQGITGDDGKIVAFSLGNFAFAKYRYSQRNTRLTRENLMGAILKLILKPGKVVSHEIIHTKQEKDTIVRDNSERRRAEFAKRQAPLVSADYVKHWRRYLRRRLFKRILYWTNILHWRNIHKETIIGGFLMLKGFFRPTAKK